MIVGVSLTGIIGNASGRGGHCRSGWASDGGHGELSDLVSGESERAEVGAVDASSALACPELVGEDGGLGDFWRSASLIFSTKYGEVQSVACPGACRTLQILVPIINHHSVVPSSCGMVASAASWSKIEIGEKRDNGRMSSRLFGSHPGPSQIRTLTCLSCAYLSPSNSILIPSRSVASR
jgi:hypothetical protein